MSCSCTSGYVELVVVEEFVVEHLKDALTDLLGWPVAAWKFRKNKKTRQDVAPPTPVAELFDDLRHRATTWETILAATGGPDAVPALAAASPSDEVALGPNEWALLCKVDSSRSVNELASECGFTLFEAGQVVMRLLDAGLVAVTHPSIVEVAEVETEDAGGVELVLPVVALEELEAREAAERQEAQERAEQEERDRAELEAREAAEQAEAERVEAERVAAERQAERSRLSGSRPSASRPSGPRPSGSRPSGSRPSGSRPSRLEAERVEAERVAAEQAEAERRS